MATLIHAVEPRHRASLTCERVVARDPAYARRRSTWTAAGPQRDRVVEHRREAVDATMIGKTTIKRGPETSRARPSIPTLRVLFTPGRPLPEPPRRIGASTTIGRVEGATILLANDGQVSRTHATITATGGALRITDSSTNGTFVGGKRVKEAPLADGDLIRVGDSLLLVRFVSDDAAIEPEAHGLLGDAPAMHDVRRTVALVGPTDATVLVTGPSGTGKEVVARALHKAYRPKGPFVAVNCGAIPESLAESQLFGHVAGAFTGAKSDHPGFFRAASGGMIFLDEIGELPLGLQAKLLRALEERAVIPVGAVHPVAFDARVVAATNRSLALEVANGNFRGDLLARLTEIEVSLPPLRQRAEDVLPLLRHALGDDAPPVSADLAEGLLLHAWPYNVRELFKVAAELKIRGAGMPVLELRLVGDRLKRAAVSAAPPAPSALPSIPIVREKDDRPIPSREELVALLREHHGSVADVARATGRSRKQVYRWIESHGIDVETFRAE
jgi:DNA-binding NtrC family response regulator